MQSGPGGGADIRRTPSAEDRCVSQTVHSLLRGQEELGVGWSHGHNLSGRE